MSNEVHICRDGKTWYEKNGTLIGNEKALFDWLVDRLDLNKHLPITLKEASARFEIPYSTIAQAAREYRIGVKREVGTWLTTEDAVEQAMAEGKMRDRRVTNEED